MAILTDVLQYGTNSHPTTSETANAYATDLLSDGVIGSITTTSGVAPMTGAFAMNAQGTPDTTVAVTAGVAYGTVTPTGQGSQRVRIKMTANQNVTIASNSTGGTRYDWIYLKIDPTNANNPNAAADNVTTLFTSRSTSNTTDNGTPPSFGYLIGIVTVANGFSTITNSVIADRRSQVGVTQTSVTSISDGWLLGMPAPTSVTYNGNRNYSLVFNSTNLTTYVSNGMRLKLTRTVAAPTQCTSLNGTTQYYSKTSPAGMTFTDNFTIMSWLKLTSYSTAAIVERRDAGANNGFSFQTTSSGQLLIDGRSGGAARNFTSYQSLPLNKWVHVAATLTMSTNTANIYIDGVLVPSFSAGAGTVLAQSGTFTIGASAVPGSFFPGKIAQAAIFSAVISQATIQSYISQGLAGTETSLISAYSFNGVITDLNTTNANNLTANGSAVATNADSPFAQAATAGSLEYGIITSNSFSTNTTLTVQVPEGSAIPTSGGVSAVSYSTQKAPYGFPADRGKWVVESLSFVDYSQNSPTQNVFYNLGSHQVAVPVGAWRLTGAATFYTSVTSGGAEARCFVSTSTSTNTDYLFGNIASGVGVTVSGTLAKTRSIVLSSATPYYLITANTSGTTPNAIYNFGARGGTILEAELAYL